MLSENLIRAFESFVIMRCRSMAPATRGRHSRRFGGRVRLLRLFAFGLLGCLFRGHGGDIKVIIGVVQLHGVVVPRLPNLLGLLGAFAHLRRMKIMTSTTTMSTTNTMIMTMMLTELTAWVVAVDFALAMASIMSMADWDQFGP